MNIFTFAQICSAFFVIFNKFFYYLLLFSISLSYKSKIYLALLFRLKNAENQYMNHKKYGVHLGFSGTFDLVWLQYSSAARKTHSSSARACSPSTRTANSTLGLKRPTLRPRYAQYTISPHTPAENTTSAFLSRERKWHFRAGYGKKL